MAKAPAQAGRLARHHQCRARPHHTMERALAPALSLRSALAPYHGLRGHHTHPAVSQQLRVLELCHFRLGRRHILASPAQAPTPAFALRRRRSSTARLPLILARRLRTRSRPPTQALVLQARPASQAVHRAKLVPALLRALRVVVSQSRLFRFLQPLQVSQQVQAPFQAIRVVASQSRPLWRLQSLRLFRPAQAPFQATQVVENQSRPLRRLQSLRRFQLAQVLLLLAATRPSLLITPQSTRPFAQLLQRKRLAARLRQAHTRLRRQ